MRRLLWLVILTLSVHWHGFAIGAEWRVGTSRIDITPTNMLWMSGYASRKHPAEGTVHPLWAKTLVVEDRGGERMAIVAMDLIGDEFGREMPNSVGTRAQQRTGIGRDRIILNASHTHCGPVTRVSDGALVTYGLDAQQQELVKAYRKTLEDKLIAGIVAASENLRPAELYYGVGNATFGANRRTRYNPDGPVDHSVPVLKVCDEDGGLVTVLFGYACHNTTLGGNFYQYCGDYAGFAETTLEEGYRNANAMYLAGCGADINPAPRGTIELAKQHGDALAAAVEKVLSGKKLRPVRGPLSVSFERVDLPFVDPPSYAQLRDRIGKGNVYDQRLTKVLIKRIDTRGSLEKSYPCPVHVVKFGTDLSMIAIGGEVVVDYALRLKKEFAGQPVWVAGYSSEVFAYVPSERVLAEGGYEAKDAMRYFGFHGPFEPGVEDQLVSAVKRLMQSRE